MMTISKKSTAPRVSETASERTRESAKDDSKQPRPRVRREQARAIETREAILRAALSEFAEQGYEAASIRNIASRTGLNHPLVTYHFRTKEILWKAVAEDAFSIIAKMWQEHDTTESLPPLKMIEGRYADFLRFTLSHPDFHHFMLRENRPGNPRLPWLVDTILRPTMDQILPGIIAAQEEGYLPDCNPVLFHYMMIGVMSVLSSLKDEMRQGSGIVTDDPQVVDAYLGLVNQLIFSRRKKKADAQKAPQDQKALDVPRPRKSATARRT